MSFIARPLGESTFSVSRVSQGCLNWEVELTISPGVVHHTFTVPAHRLDIGFKEVKNAAGIPQGQVTEYFKGEFGPLRKQYIDLESIVDAPPTPPVDMQGNAVGIDQEDQRLVLPLTLTHPIELAPHSFASHCRCATSTTRSRL